MKQDDYHLMAVDYCWLLTICHYNINPSKMLLHVCYGYSSITKDPYFGTRYHWCGAEQF